MNIRNSRVLIVAGAALAVVMAAGGYSLAAATSRTPVDTACVTARHVPERIYARNAKCPAGTGRIQWNQKGPAGPPGAPGVGHAVVSQNEVPLGGTGTKDGIQTITSGCPDHGYAVGGGFAFVSTIDGDPPIPYPVVSSGPGGVTDGQITHQWVVQVQPPAPTSPPHANPDQVDVYAICAK